MNHIGSMKIARRRAIWFQCRWLLLTLFAISFWWTVPKMGHYALEYFALTFFAVAFCALLLLLLPRNFHNYAPIWVVFAAYLLAYFGKFYLLVYAPDIMTDVYFNRLAWHTDSAESWLEVYAVVVQGFMSICISACLVAVILRGSRYSQRAVAARTRRIGSNDAFAVSKLAWMLPLLMSLTALVAWIFGIGEMGAGQNEAKLPYRLDGLIFYSRLIFISALLLLYNWLAMREGNKKHIYFALFLLIAHGLSEMLLRSSKGFLVVLLIQLFFLLALTGKMDKKKIKWFGAFLLFAIPLYSFMAGYRLMKLANPELGIFDVLSTSITFLPDYLAESSSYDKGLFWVFVISFTMRLVGVDSLALAMGIPYAQGAINITHHFNEMLGTFGVAPSFLGWLYLHGGVIFVWMGGIILFILMLIWLGVMRLELRSLPVIQSVFLFWILMLFTEGTIDSQGLGLSVMLASFVFIELFMKYMDKKQRRAVATHPISKLGLSS